MSKVPSFLCKKCKGLYYVYNEIYNDERPACSIRYGLIQKSVIFCETFKHK